MQLILRPVKHVELDALAVTESPVSIGRNEKPFSEYSDEIADTLSRRHARIFPQADAYYLADLGSSNGTLLNGQTVSKEPRKLTNGDILEFAPALVYKLELSGNEQPTRFIKSQETDNRLTLIAENDVIDNLVIERFPFLISKESTVFSRYEDKEPGEVLYLSRKHAYIFRKNGALYLEDLGSTNGTFLNTDRLNEKAVRINSGDEVKFGGDFFRYRVEILASEAVQETKLQPSTASDQVPALEGKTTFINSATSFIDIFCLLEENENENPETGQEDQSRGIPQHPKNAKDIAAEHRGKTGGVAGYPGRFGRAVARVDNRIYGIILFLVASALAIWWTLQDPLKEEIIALCDQGRYQECAVKAIKYREKYPGQTDEATQWGLSALIKWTVPIWKQQMEEDNFSSTNSLVSEIKSMSNVPEDFIRHADLMAWGAKMEAYFKSRGGVDGGFRLFSDEQEVMGILQGVDEIDVRTAFTRIIREVPESEALYRKFESRIALLRRESDRFIQGSDELIENIKSALPQGEAVALQVIQAAERKLSGVIGLDALRQDVARFYEVYDPALDLIGKSFLLNSHANFKTALFKEDLSALLPLDFPTKELAQHIRQSAGLWMEGNHEASFELLQSINHSTWQPEINKLISEQKNTIKQFELLNTMRGTKAFAESLAVFRQGLHPERDKWLLERTEKDFEIYREQAQQQIEKLLSTASRQWGSYISKGGISGQNRIDTRVSKQYRRQASVLVSAWRAATSCQQISQDYSINIPGDGRKVLQEIFRERNVQIESLRKLRQVLSANVVDKKLELLQVR